MSADIETVAVCPQYRATWDVQGSADNVYTVTLDGPSCTCPAFKYSGEPGDQHCKHIDRVRAHGCFYSPQADPGPNDYTAYGIEVVDMDRNVIAGAICPGCGQDMIAIS